ncbi:fibronectin type III-like domain-contianing protein [Erwinia psidii]|uniref:fibronectin type III-like domain-contianing protein n=1 Tax=Erwinia psidii TaxID=69224 RepID=UPI0018F4A587
MCDPVSSRVRPVRELRAFKRVPLKAGETQTVRFTLTRDNLAFYNGDNQFVAEPGEFQLWAGGDSHSGSQAPFRFAL